MSVSKSLRIVLTVAVVACGFLSQASAGEGSSGACSVRYVSFRPEVTVAPLPMPAGSNNTTPAPVTAPQHNKCPSPLVPQAPYVVEFPSTEAFVELAVDVNFALNNVGSVIMRTETYERELTVTEWSHRQVKFRMPNIGVLQKFNVSIHIYRPDGYLVREFPAQLIRSKSIRRVTRGPQTAVTVK